MAASRQLNKITIYFDDLTGLPNTIDAITIAVASEQGLTVTSTKGYSVEYETLSVGGKTKVDDFIDDVNAFIQNQEPIIP